MNLNPTEDETMSTETDDARTRQVQLQTCPCCKLHWKTTKQLTAHLDLMLGRIAAKQAQLKGAA